MTCILRPFAAPPIPRTFKNRVDWAVMASSGRGEEDTDDDEDPACIKDGVDGNDEDMDEDDNDLESSGRWERYG
ncbi:hypothetical protein EDD11_003235 [Mortierella claussenii]|nr:hypothetical protein EDD11_003235 [Mortierella claussenii]